MSTTGPSADEIHVTERETRLAKWAAGVAVLASIVAAAASLYTAHEQGNVSLQVVTNQAQAARLERQHQERAAAYSEFITEWRGWEIAREPLLTCAISEERETALLSDLSLAYNEVERTATTVLILGSPEMQDRANTAYEMIAGYQRNANPIFRRLNSGQAADAPWGCIDSSTLWSEDDYLIYGLVEEQARLDLQ